MGDRYLTYDQLIERWNSLYPRCNGPAYMKDFHKRVVQEHFKVYKDRENKHSDFDMFTNVADSCEESLYLLEDVERFERWFYINENDELMHENS